MSHSPLPPPLLAPTDVAGRLAVDAACRRCGYNLRGLGLDGVCPECNALVGWSLHGELLQFADPDWVTRVASGMTWLAVGVVVGAAMGCVAGGLNAALRGGGGPIAGLTGLATSLVLLIGYLRVTAPDPSEAPAAGGLTARRLCRGAACVGSGCSAVGLMDAFGAGGVVLPLLSLFGALVGIVAAVALLVYLRRLCLRIPDVGLAKHLRIVTWGLGVSQGAMCVLSAVVVVLLMPALTAAIAATATAPAMTVTTAPALMPAAGPVGGFGGPGGLPGLARGRLALLVGLGGIIGLGTLVFSIWNVVLLFRCRSALLAAAETARRVFAAIGRPAGAPG